MTGKHEPPNPASFYLSVATSTLRAAIILAAIVFGGFVLANAFPDAGSGTVTPPTGVPSGTGSTPSPGTTTTAPPPEVTVEGSVLQVLNATDVTGLAAQVANRLKDDGAIVPGDNVGNFEGPNLDITELQFRQGYQPLARLLRDTYFPGATLTRVEVNELKPDVQVTIVVAQDYADAQGLGS